VSLEINILQNSAHTVTFVSPQADMMCSKTLFPP